MGLERAAERGHARLKILPQADATPAVARTLVRLSSEEANTSEEQGGARGPLMFSLPDTHGHLPLPAHLASKFPAV